MAKTVGIYLQTNTEKEILKRGDNRSHIINRDLERLYAMYRRSIREVQLTEKETCLIVDALNDRLFNGDSAVMLHANIENACRLDGLGEKWEVDGPALVEKLRSLSTFHCLALIDAAECWWNLPVEERDMSDSLRRFFSVSEGGE